MPRLDGCQVREAVTDEGQDRRVARGAAWRGGDVRPLLPWQQERVGGLDLQRVINDPLPHQAVIHHRSLWHRFSPLPVLRGDEIRPE